MILQIIFLSIIGGGFGILQTTLLYNILPMGVVPDIALVTLVFVSWRYGSLTGEITGFFIGFVFDVLSLSPLGFHSFLFSIIGYLFGRLRNNISPDAVLLPLAAGFSATLIKHGGAAFLSFVFSLNGSGRPFFTIPLALELAENAVLSPIVFLLGALIAKLLEGKRGGFQ